MRKLVVLTVFAVSLALVAPTFAGEGHKCTAGTQECLNKMVAKLKTKGWVGIEMDKDEAKGSMTVKKVVPDSPAMQAGFKVGDMLVAVNGVAFTKKKEEMKKAYKSWAPGDAVTYTVKRHGKEKELNVTLGKVPEDVLAAWVGGHMIEHATVEVAKK